MVDALKYLGSLEGPARKGGVVVRGDSSLVTQFMQGTATPGKRELVMLITEAKKLCRWNKFGKVCF